MQKHELLKTAENAPYVVIDELAAVANNTHGKRAKCLQRLIRLGLPVPLSVALSFDTVRGISSGLPVETADILASFGPAPLVSVRPSSEEHDWGGPQTVLNIGMNDARHGEVSELLGRTAADQLYARFIQTYAVDVASLDPDLFEVTDTTSTNDVRRLKEAYEAEMDEAFPQDPARQLSDVLRSMARAWNGTTARLLRQARGAPADAGLGLVVQAMAPGMGPPESGSGVIQFISPASGKPQVTGRYLSQSQGRDALSDAKAVYLTKDERGASLEELCPDGFQKLIEFAAVCRDRLREEMQIEFTLDGGVVSVLDAVKVKRSARADVRVAVTLAEDGVISKEEALNRIAPGGLSEMLHRQIDEDAPRTVLTQGIAASPGAPSGRLVFNSAAA